MQFQVQYNKSFGCLGLRKLRFITTFRIVLTPFFDMFSDHVSFNGQFTSSRSAHVQLIEHFYEIMASRLFKGENIVFTPETKVGNC